MISVQHKRVKRVKLRRYYGGGMFEILNDGRHYPNPPNPEKFKSAYKLWKRGLGKFRVLESSITYCLYRFIKRSLKGLGKE